MVDIYTYSPQNKSATRLYHREKQNSGGKRSTYIRLIITSPVIAERLNHEILIRLRDTPTLTPVFFAVPSDLVAVVVGVVVCEPGGLHGSATVGGVVVGDGIALGDDVVAHGESGPGCADVWGASDAVDGVVLYTESVR